MESIICGITGQLRTRKLSHLEARVLIFLFQVRLVRPVHGEKGKECIQWSVLVENSPAYFSVTYLIPHASKHMDCRSWEWVETAELRAMKDGESGARTCFIENLKWANMVVLILHSGPVQLKSDWWCHSQQMRGVYAICPDTPVCHVVSEAMTSEINNWSCTLPISILPISDSVQYT